MGFGLIASILAAASCPQDSADRLREEVGVVHGEVVSPRKSLMDGDVLRIVLVDPAGVPGATFEGRARLFVAVDDPVARTLDHVTELPRGLFPFTGSPVSVTGGVVEMPVAAVGIQTALSAFVARLTPAGLLVSRVVQVTVTSVPASSGRIDPARIAVFANSEQAQSMAVAAEYVEARGIPPQNLVVVSFNATDPLHPALQESEFLSEIQPAIDALPPSIDLVALSWTLPYKVVDDSSPKKVMSITSAFMLGTGPENFVQGVQGGCVFPAEYAPSPLYDSDVRDYGQAGLPRPTLLLGGDDTLAALDLVARGVASDGTHPAFDGYLVSANPPRSNPRVPDMLETVDVHEGNSWFGLEFHEVGSGPDPVGQDLLLYQTGDFIVEDVELNGFLPGAVADNLDSWGGNLEAEVQGHMNLMRWMNAGVTGSYGTVREPCSFPGKFPATSVLVRRYFAGESLAEAYVKSVRFPQEGVFVGDPAACPYCR